MFFTNKKVKCLDTIAEVWAIVIEDTFKKYKTGLISGKEVYSLIFDGAWPEPNKQYVIKNKRTNYYPKGELEVLYELKGFPGVWFNSCYFE